MRLIIWVKKNATDQIIFISSPEYLGRVARDMKAGKMNIYTKLERKIISDLRDLKKRRKGDLSGDFELKDLRRTLELTKFTKVLQAFLRLLMEMLVSYSDSVCYVLMIVSMMKNAGLISLLYPLVVFGYALMEEVNPRKRVWYLLMMYTEMLIMAKFIF